MYSWTPKTNAMIKVIVTLTAAASTMFGQMVETDVKPVKPEPIKKEILKITPLQEKPAEKKSNDDTKLA